MWQSKNINSNFLCIYLSGNFTQRLNKMDYGSKVFIIFSDGISLFIYNWHLKNSVKNAIWKALYPYFLQFFSSLSFSLFYSTEENVIKK